MPSIEQITSEMEKGLARAGGLGARSAKIAFVGEGVVFLTGSTATNEDRDADCTLTLLRSDYEALREGRLNPTMAVMTGKIKLRGDTALALKLQGILKPSRHK